MSTAGLQEWVAEEKGYYHDEGLDYEFIRNGQAPVASAAPEAALTALQRRQEPKRSVPQIEHGAFESLEAGRDCDVSMACHWAVNMASSTQVGRMWGHAYMLTFAGIMVPPESPITKPDDLKGVEIAVGYHSGSHFSCLQYLEPFIAPKDVVLSFAGGPPDRLDHMIERKIPAANMWGTQKDILEGLGFRKIVDTTYMQGFLLSGDVDTDQCWQYFNALKRAQVEIDAHSERYKSYFIDHVPARYRELVDVRGFSNGKRIVFEEYTQEVYESTHRWMEDLDIFAAGQLGHAEFEDAVLV